MRPRESRVVVKGPMWHREWTGNVIDEVDEHILGRYMDNAAFRVAVRAGFGAAADACVGAKRAKPSE